MIANGPTNHQFLLYKKTENAEQTHHDQMQRARDLLTSASKKSSLKNALSNEDEAALQNIVDNRALNSVQLQERATLLSTLENRLQHQDAMYQLRNFYL